MRHVFATALLFTFTCTTPKNELPGMTHLTNLTYSLLCLGDSYTIGESVLLHESFPYQTVQVLRRAGYAFQSPEIVAKTGWTTDELRSEIDRYTFLPKYDFVTLLIGVNNQYRGKTVDSYKHEFEDLLERAIQLAGNDTSHVVVLSIPDWGVTPFAEGRDRKQIAKDIDAYNAANRSIAGERHAGYLDITASTREATGDQTLLATDGLHPSAKEYNRWAVKLSDKFKSSLP